MTSGWNTILSYTKNSRSLPINIQLWVPHILRGPWLPLRPIWSIIQPPCLRPPPHSGQMDESPKSQEKSFDWVATLSFRVDFSAIVEHNWDSVWTIKLAKINNQPTINYHQFNIRSNEKHLAFWNRFAHIWVLAKNLLQMCIINSMSGAHALHNAHLQ